MMMIAFHGSQATKSKYLSRVREHRAADQIVKGTFWADGKGCAVGCTIHSANHRAYETELGIPIALARLEDSLFESLPNDVAMEWPERFLDAIPVSADLSMVEPQFLYWLLADENDGVISFADERQFPDVRAVVQNVAALLARWISGGTVTRQEWINARDAAFYAASAASYATHAFYAASTADAALSDSASSATFSASAASSCATASDTSEDASIRAFRVRVRQSERLLELLKTAPVAAEVIAQ